MERNTVMVECRTYCELTIDDKAVMYIDGWNVGDRTRINATASKDSIPYKLQYAMGQWIYNNRLLPVCHGIMVATDVCRDERKLTDSINKDIKSETEKWIAELEKKNKRTERELDELDYYLKKHDVQDNGFNTVAEHATKIRCGHEASMRTEKLLKGISWKNKARLRLITEYTLLYIYDDKSNDDRRNNCKQTERIKCKLLERDGSRNICLIQTADGTTPEGAFPIYAKNCIAGGMTISKDIQASDFFDSKGQLKGHATVNIGNSMTYSGMFANGMKQGNGITENVKTGDRIVGTWNADTLTNGTRRQDGETYKGMFNSRMTAEGHGIYTNSTGEYYDGDWTDGQRNGFGCGIDSTGKVKAGEWTTGRYRGERMRYTPDRIYGIDISRHQHEKGKKKYAINWNAIRITHLGKISTKDIHGKVDYPVSFVYIKSTEGMSVRNRYYRSDYIQARKHGIKCGTYHFFSTTSKASKQAMHFLRNSRFTKGDFPPVLDVEPSAAQIKKMGGTQAMFAAIRTWMNIVERHTGMRPILYVNQQFVNKYLPSAPDIKRKYRVWIARYGEYKPDVRLLFWQLSPDGRVAGIHGDVDINVFNGYTDEYKQFCNAPAY